jgi:DNA-binding HxlR family transcriptional regulator
MVVECPIEVVVNLLGDKWKVLIMRNLLLKGTQRFGELNRGINGVSQKMLTQQLRQLETDGLIGRKIYPEVPPRVEYSLTEFGQTLKPIFDAMHIWGDQLPGASRQLRKGAPGTVRGLCSFLKCEKEKGMSMRPGIT